jgi:hypothetical protein
MNNIITRLNAAAIMLREHEQYNDDPDCNGEGLAADACDDAIGIISELVNALENAADALDAYSGGIASELEHIKKAIAASTTGGNA